MTLDNVSYIKVYPGIGTGRVGNSPEYFIGPQFPGEVPNLDKPYKDSNGYLKPQAAKFRVYAYDSKDKIIGEVTHDPSNNVTLEWDVHMRNLKAANYAFQGKFGFNPDQYRNPGVMPNKPGTDPNDRKSLIIDAGAQTISGINLGLKNHSAVHLEGHIFKGGFQAEVPSSLYDRGATGNTMVTYKEKLVSLGRLETDEAGRLIVVGGKGEAGCLIEPPIILQKGTATFVEGTNVLLGDAASNSPVTKGKFYSNSVTVDLLDQVTVFLASTSDGTGEVFADDSITLSITGKNNEEKGKITTTTFSYLFEKGTDGKITPEKPIEITEEIKPYLGSENVNITIEYSSNGGNQGASAFYLSYINGNPTSNGNSYFNNPGWYDDTAGGSINAVVTINGKQHSTKENGLPYGDPEKRGWVAISPPKYVPTMNNVVSLLDLQLAMYPEEDPVSGTVNFALIDENNVPNFSPVSITNFDPLSGLPQGKGSPSIARYNGKDYMAYTATNGKITLAVSENGSQWTQVNLNIQTNTHQPFNDKTNFSPSLCVFNGELNYVIIVEGEIAIGTSTDGVNFVFEILPTDPPSKQGAPLKPYATPVPSISAPSAVPYNGQLYIGFVTTGNKLAIAHKYLVPNTQDFYYAFNETDQQVCAKTAPSLAVIFGELYCAYTGMDQNAYLGNYNNYSPAPAEPTSVNFTFEKVSNAPKSKISPSIASSLGKLYYGIVGTGCNIHLAIASPTDLASSMYKKVNFTGLGHTSVDHGIAIANFSDIEFYRDVYPILKTVTDYAWVNEPAFHGHAPGKPGDFLRDNSLPYYSNPNATNNFYRSFVFNFLRQPEQLTPDVPPPPAAIPNPTNKTVKGIKPSIPDGGVQTGTLMPHLFGEGGSPLENGFNGTNFPNQWLSLTPHQLWKCQEWVNGNFTAGTKPNSDVPSKGKKFEEEVMLVNQPAALNFSALEPTVGGGFHPGIELTYYMKEPGFFAEAFRFADTITNDGVPVQPITPGSVAGYMSIPWQGDFWSCNISWWAAMRPDIVIPTEVPPPFIPWYRGEGVGIPANADNIPDYEAGYEHMVRYWSDFGYVVPTGATDRGMFVMEETERNFCLDNVTEPCAAFNEAESALIGTAVKQANSSGASTTPFYNNKIDLLIPASGKIILAGSEDGTAQISTDDEVKIYMCYNTWETSTVDGIKTTKISANQTKALVFHHDFSNGNSGKITPIAPQDITDAIRSVDGYHPGTIVTIEVEYIDTYGGKRSASEFWLVYPEPAVHLGVSQPKTKLPANFQVPFYSNTIPVRLPATGKVILSGSADGSADFKIDNELVIYIDKENPVYGRDFGGTASAPVDITLNLQDYMGTTVFMEIQYLSSDGESEATDIWLTFES